MFQKTQQKTRGFDRWQSGSLNNNTKGLQKQQTEGQWIGLRENFNRKAPYLMGESMVSCRFSLKPIHWEGLQQRNSGYDRDWEANLPMTASLVGLPTEKLSLEVGNTAIARLGRSQQQSAALTEHWLIFVLPRWKQLITRSSPLKKVTLW